MIRSIILFKPFAKFILIAWLLIIIILSSIPNIPTLKIHTARTEIRLDYLIHFCEYGILAFVAFLSFAGNEFIISCKKFIMIALSLILFAVLDEFHQKFIPGRAFNIKDVMSNISGILAVMIFTIVVFRFVRIRLKKFE